jgi:hypothetical protein
VTEARDIRSYQRQASAAADLAAERDRRKWSKESLETERRIGRPHARLYRLIDIAGGVKTPMGQGTLIQAFSDRCLVLLTRGGKTAKRLNGTPYKPMKEFRPEEIEPYRKGE